MPAIINIHFDVSIYGKHTSMLESSSDGINTHQQRFDSLQIEKTLMYRFLLSLGDFDMYTSNEGKRIIDGITIEIQICSSVCVSFIFTSQSVQI